MNRPPRPHDRTTGAGNRRAREAAFSLVEILVAAFILLVAITGAMTASASMDKSRSLSDMRDRQAAVLQSVSDKLRGDPTWLEGARTTCGNLGSSAIDLDAAPGRWLSKATAEETAADPGTGVGFTVVGSARPVDSEADGTCPDDADGIVPDYFQVELAARPDDSTRDRFPSLRSRSENYQIEYVSESAGGKLLVQACYVTPQIDERQPSNMCANPSEPQRLLPPTSGTFDTPTSFTCTKAESTVRNLKYELPEGSECRAYQCADPDVDQTSCTRGTIGDEAYVSFTVEPASGWSGTATGIDDANSGVSVPFTLDANGRVELDDLQPGRYEVELDAPSAYVPWASHSVPATGIATVERGIRSTVVQMYKPATVGFRLPIRTLDVAAHTFIPYFEPNRGLKITLMPIPFGRAQRPPFQSISMGATHFDFTGVEPGLYAYAGYQPEPRPFVTLADNDAFDSWNEYGSFFFVHPDGTMSPASPIWYQEKINYTACSCGNSGGGSGGGGGS